MCFDAKHIIGNPHQYLYDHSAIQEYLAEHDSSPEAERTIGITSLEQPDSQPITEQTLAVIDPYEYEQLEQENRDAQLDKDSRWHSRLIHYVIRKPR
jgi:hypothetical protein